MRFKNKQEEREYKESIKGDVNDFMKELVGTKKHEFPVGDTKKWREEQEKDKDDKKVSKDED